MKNEELINLLYEQRQQILLSSLFILHFSLFTFTLHFSLFIFHYSPAGFAPLYSEGVIPVSFLKHLLKYFGSEKPTI